MSLSISKDGTISIHQGDSGKITISGLDTSKNYSVYFAVKNRKRETVGDEICVNSNFMSKVTFFITSDFSDLLTVPLDEDYETYYYGIKLCDNESEEDTLFVANADYGRMNYILVYPKIVEGKNGK